MSQNKYDIGDRVFLKSSADAGFLESYLIKNISILSDTIIQYEMVTRGQPQNSITMGDRIPSYSDVNNISLSESDLVSEYEALSIVKSKLEHELSEINQKLAAISVT